MEKRFDVDDGIECWYCSSEIAIRGITIKMRMSSTNFAIKPKFHEQKEKEVPTSLATSREDAKKSSQQMRQWNVACSAKGIAAVRRSSNVNSSKLTGQRQFVFFYVTEPNWFS